MITPDQVKAARKLLHWSQIKLAVEADMSYATVAKFDKGEPPITESKIRAIHDALIASGMGESRSRPSSWITLNYLKRITSSQSFGRSLSL
jgi:transcriptional regulator with XRE-family HTH domain